jgi:hypothetical protein
VSFDTLAKSAMVGIEAEPVARLAEPADRSKADLRDPGVVAEDSAAMNVRKANLDGQLRLQTTNLPDPGRRGAAAESRLASARSVEIESTEWVSGDHRAKVKRAPPDCTGEPS